MNSPIILGAGGYGIVVKLGTQAVKLFYDTNAFGGQNVPH